MVTMKMIPLNVLQSLVILKAIKFYSLNSLNFVKIKTLQYHGALIIIKNVC